MKKLLAILSVVLFANQASANFHSGTEEENERLSRLIMQYGEIIHSADMKFLGKDLIGGAVFHVRIKKPNRMELLGVPEGIYVCFAGLDVTATQLSEIEEDQTFISCEKL